MARGRSMKWGWMISLLAVPGTFDIEIGVKVVQTG